jgi:hypothetical protein
MYKFQFCLCMMLFDILVYIKTHLICMQYCFKDILSKYQPITFQNFFYLRLEAQVANSVIVQTVSLIYLFCLRNGLIQNDVSIVWNRKELYLSLNKVIFVYDVVKTINAYNYFKYSMYLFIF